MLAVLTGAAGMGMLGGKMALNKYVLAAFAPAVIPFALLGLEFILRRRDLGPLLVLIVAAFVPIKIPTGSGSSLVGSLLVMTALAGIWLLRMLCLEKRFWLYPSPVNAPLLAFMLVTVVSLIWSNLLVDPLVSWRRFAPVQLASTLVMIMLPSSFLLTANQSKDLGVLKAMVWAMLAAGALGLVKQYEIVESLPVNTSGLFSMWVIALTLGQAFFDAGLRRGVRALLLILAGAYVVWGFGLHISWLAGWLPSLIAAGILIFRRSKLLAAACAVVLAGYVLANTDHYLGTVLADERAVSGDTRLAAWKINWRVTSQHLLFGTGPAGYADYYLSYFPEDSMATHSNYIDILAQTGVVGLAAYLSFFAILALRGYRLCRRVRGRGDFVEGLANASFAGTIGSIVIMGFGDWLIPFAYTQTIAGFGHAVYSWLFMGTILVIERLVPTGTEPARLVQSQREL